MHDIRTPTTICQIVLLLTAVISVFRHSDKQDLIDLTKIENFSYFKNEHNLPNDSPQNQKLRDLNFSEALYKPVVMSDQQILDRDGFMANRGLHVASVICIGVKKCGTGALRQWLSAHSRVVVSNKEEPTFFSNNAKFNDSNKMFSNYAKSFPVSLPSDLVFEKTPRYKI